MNFIFYEKNNNLYFNEDISKKRDLTLEIGKIKRMEFNLL